LQDPSKVIPHMPVCNLKDCPVKPFLDRLPHCNFQAILSSNYRALDADLPLHLTYPPGLLADIIDWVMATAYVPAANSPWPSLWLW
jgi:hypothetical protein